MFAVFRRITTKFLGLEGILKENESPPVEHAKSERWPERCRRSERSPPELRQPKSVTPTVSWPRAPMLPRSLHRPWAAMLPRSLHLPKSVTPAVVAEAAIKLEECTSNTKCNVIINWRMCVLACVAQNRIIRLTHGKWVNDCTCMYSSILMPNLLMWRIVFLAD